MRLRIPLLGPLSSRLADLELLRRHGLRPVGGAAAGHVQVAPDGTGKDVDADSLTSTEGGTPTVYRQNTVISDPTTYAAKTAVSNAAPAGTEYGMVVRPANTTPDRATIAQSLTTSATTNNIALAIPGTGIAALQITGVWTGTLATEATVDGTNWFTIPVLVQVASGWRIDPNWPGNSGNGNWIIPCAGYAQLRVRCFSTGTGTATVSLEASIAPFQIPVDTYIGTDGTGQRVATWTNAVAFGLNPSSLRDFLRTRDASGARIGVLMTTRPGVPSYAASTNGAVAIPTTLSTTTSLAYLFHGAGVAKRYEIYRIQLDSPGASTASAAGQITTIRLANITAENGTPGGTSQTINALDQADAASGGTFRTGATGAPTRTAGDLYSWNLSTVGTNVTQTFVWDALQDNEGKPLVVRASTAEGWELRSVTNGTAIGAAINVGITYWWKEL